MANKRPLKVFRTSVGFEDAYIAAPSQKAALAAWGAKGNLFARGAAEVVTDPALAKAALERPGEVIRVPRGTAAEHLAAAGGGKSQSARGPKPRKAGHDDPPTKPAPRPSRARLDRAHDQLSTMQSDLGAIEKELAGQIDGLKEELNALKKHNAGELAKLQRDVEKEERHYRQALARWREALPD